MTAATAVADKVRNALARELKRDPATITPEQALREDLGLNSLDAIELMFKVEEEFDLEIPDADLQRLRTVGDLVSYLEGRLGGVPAPGLARGAPGAAPARPARRRSPARRPPRDDGPPAARARREEPDASGAGARPARAQALAHLSRRRAMPRRRAGPRGGQARGHRPRGGGHARRTGRGRHRRPQEPRGGRRRRSHLRGQRPLPARRPPLTGRGLPRGAARSRTWTARRSWSPNPAYAAACVVQQFFTAPYRPRGIARPLARGRGVIIGAHPSIWPFVTLGDRVRLGDRVTLYPGVFIGDDCTVGDDTVVYPGPPSWPGVAVGARVIIGSGSGDRQRRLRLRDCTRGAITRFPSGAG